MRLLITGGDGRLARAVAVSLAGEAEVRSIDATFPAGPVLSGVETRTGDLRDPAFVGEVLAGVDAVLHLAPLAPTSPDDGTAVLDEAGRGSYVLLNTALEMGVRRFIVGSTLDLFDRLPAHWKVDENWRPRPEPRPEHLGPWLAELSVRESARTVADARALCLRFGRLVDDAEAAREPFDPRWLHVEDAVQGVRQAVAWLQNDDRSPGWRVFHITAPGPRAAVRLSAAGWDGFGYQPVHDFRERWSDAPVPPVPDERPWRQVLAPPEPIPSRSIHNVVVFGAGGPVAAATAELLAPAYTLRLTDARPLADIVADNKPQSKGAPLPVPPEPPHEERVVDVRDADAVLAACEGMDAVVNCTVVRPDPIDAFRVNLLGAYHIVRAAVAHRIRRVVQTGPELIAMDRRIGYTTDYDVPGDVPPRPGRSLYGHSKYLGQEVCRVFADHYGLEIPTLLYCQFVNPEVTEGLHYFSVSWRDSARAIRHALEVPSLPAPFEVMHIAADLPHGRIRTDRARLVLGWEAEDDMAHLWKHAQE